MPGPQGFPQKQVDTEEVFSKLFSLGCSIGCKGSQTPFHVTSRRWVSWDRLPVNQMPAFYQFQPPQTVSGADRGLPVWKLAAWWFVYLPAAQGDQPVSPLLNRYRDALVGLLDPSPASPRPNLGIQGVSHVYIDGLVFTDEGLLTAPSLIRIPITILTGR